MKKRIINILAGLLIIATSYSLYSCNQENIDENTSSQYEDLVFKVSVNNTSANSRAASDNKKSWVKGDQIYASIDASNSNICLIEFNGEDWDVKKLTAQVSFSNSGKINAVHADKLSYIEGKVTTFGDIIYTTVGTYKKEDNIVLINLDLNNRPLSKIRINGVPDGFYLDGIKEFTELDISNMSWSESNSKGQLCSELENENDYTYYGLIKNDNNNTAIKLINGKGAYYQKSFNKSLEIGKSIIIDGPLINNEWIAEIPLEGISANNQTILIMGETRSINDFITYNPSNATNKKVNISSSDESIVKVDKDGNIQGVSIGDAVLSVTSEDGNYKCDVNVSVKNITSFISVEMTGTSFVITGGGAYYGREYTIKNSGDYNVYLTEIGTSNFTDINKTLDAHSSLIKSLYFNYNVYPTVTVRFTYNGKAYEIHN